MIQRQVVSSERSDHAPGAEPSTGVEWVIDAFDCEADRLRDQELITRICEQVVVDLGLNVIGQPQVHRFGGPGRCDGALHVERVPSGVPYLSRASPRNVQPVLLPPAPGLAMAGPSSQHVHWLVR